jgi:serine protease
MRSKIAFNDMRLCVAGVSVLITCTSLPAQAEPVRYRDHSDWIEAQRAADPQQLTLRKATRTFHAQVNRRAIVTLHSSIQAAAFLRAHQLIALPEAGPDSAALAATDARAPASAPPALNPRLRTYLVESTLAAEDGLDVAVRLSAASDAIAAIPDLSLERRPAAEFEVPPNDPRYRGQWYLSHLQMERAWRAVSGKPDTTVVVIDDGCDLRHPDLEQAMLPGLDAIDDDDDPSFTPNLSGNEHGTACSGIIAAVGDNGIGISGVCPRCSLRCVRLFDKSHSLIPVSADLRAFNFAFETGAAVVSNSWGFAEPQPVTPTLRAAIEELLDRGRDGRGSVVVFAAGNENREIEDDEIAAIPGVLNVGAINNFDEAAPFSNYGRSLSLTAPTGTVTTDISGPDGADPGDYTSLFGGTSSACPVVAGVAALVMSAVPEKSGRQIVDLLMGSARPAPYATPDAQGHDKLYGRGIVDPVGALIAAGIEVPGVAEDAGGIAADGGEGRRERSAGGCGCSVAGGGPRRGLGGWLGVWGGIAWRARARARVRVRVRALG